MNQFSSGMNRLWKYQFGLLLLLGVVNPISPRYNLVQLSARRALELRIDDVILLFILLNWLVILAYDGKIKIPRGAHPTTLFLLFVCVATISMLISIVQRIESTSSILQAVLFLVKHFQYFLIFTTSFSIAKRYGAQSIAVVRFMLVGLGVTLLYGYYQILLGKFGYQSGAIGRATMLFDPGPNVLGTYLSIFIPILIAMFLLRNRERSYYISGALLASSLIVLAYTGSRASFIGTVGGSGAVLVIYLYTYRQEMAKVLLLVAGISAVIILAGVSIVDVPGPIRRLFMWDYQTTIGVREGNWFPALKTFIERPIFGTGLSLSNQVWAENYYLRLLAELGTVGFMVFIGLIGSVLRDTVATFTRETPFSPVAFGYLGSIVSVMIGNIAADKLLVFRIATPFWILGGLISGIAWYSYKSSGTEYKKHFRDPANYWS